MKVEIIELPKELTEKTACEFIGRLASVCTGKEPISDVEAERIGRMNLTEHLGKPTRCWEFLPIKDSDDEYEYLNFKYHNMRERLSRNTKLGTISKDLDDRIVKLFCNAYNRYNCHNLPYHLFKISVPKYVRDHVKTHTKLSSISSSARIGIDKEKLYEFPEIEKQYTHGVINKMEGWLLRKVTSAIENNDGGYFNECSTGKQFSFFLKKLYIRKEVTKRSLSDFEVVDMVIGGYFNEGWDNFIKVRTASCNGTFICPNEACEKPCIQKETRELALIIKGLVENA